MKPLVIAVCVALGFCVVQARADVIMEPISISATVPVLGHVFTSQFAAFNPALGTLVSLSVSLSGTTDYTGMGIPQDEGGDLEFQPDPPPTNVCAAVYNDCLDFPALGNGLPFAFMVSDVTDAGVLAEYTGAGLRDYGVYDFAGNLTDHFALTGSGTVTFNYVPERIATPEPATFSLVGISFTALAGLAYLRRRSARVPDKARDA